MANSKAKTILVVEDDKDILFALGLLLTEEGYDVQSAENGAVALEILKMYGIPHLILIDMAMPVLNGWQFAVEFYKKYEHKAPIIVMTAAQDAEQRAKNIGAIGWIGKPFLMDDLLTLIRRYERN